MADKTKIEWTDATWNPITGCTLVSEGCRNCYAARLAATRLKDHPSRAGLARINAAGVAKFTGEVRLNEKWMDQPLRWRKPRRIFVCAHGDLFAEGVPDEWIDRVFAVMDATPRHTFQVLTKRPARMRDYVARWVDGPRSTSGSEWGGEMPENIWLGVSVEDQATADERIPPLLDTPAAVRWISAEPLLGPVDLTHLRPHKHDEPGDPNALTGRWIWPSASGFEDSIYATARRTDALDWVVVGGESGPGARAMNSEWARDLRDQCEAAGVPFLFKQWGAHDEHGRLVGKAAAGRMLDGETHDAWPA